MLGMAFDQLLCKIGRVLMQDDAAFENRLQHMVSILAAYFRVEKCSLMLVNQNDLTLEVKASTNPAIIGMKRRLSDVTVSTRALLENEPFPTDRKRLSFFTPPDTTRYSSAFSLSIPIRYRNRKLGVINLTDSKSNGQLTRRQQEHAAEAAAHIATCLYAALVREQLEEKAAKYEKALAEFARMDELKTSLTGFIVHDLKGPISTVMANLDMLSYEQLTRRQMDYVALALEDVYKMQRMVMNILDVMKLEEGRVKIFREETDLYSLAEKELASFRNILAFRNMEAVLDGASRVCYIDESLIGRAVSNLLMNAMEHSPDGTKITVSIRHDPGRKETEVSVSDRGPGIPEEFKERIFDKFFQVGEERRMRKATTGLGLSFCRLVVRAHGGDIRVENAEGGGARFVFTLPEALPGL